MKKLKIWQLVLLLILVVGASVGFVLLIVFTSGPGKAVLGDNYRCEENSCIFGAINPDSYEEKIKNEESFVVFVDQSRCNTADNLRRVVSRYMKEHKVYFLKMSFSDMKETSLGEVVKYYPSVAVISKGKVIGFLHADSDAEADAFAEYEEFSAWIGQYLLVEN